MDFDKCLEVRKDGKGAPATVYKCHGLRGNQYWEYYRGVLKRDSLHLTDELVLKSFKQFPQEKARNFFHTHNKTDFKLISSEPSVVLIL